MGVATPEEIEAILAAMNQRRRERMAAKNSSQPVSDRPPGEPLSPVDPLGRETRPDSRRRRCDCGTCRMCLDNARWEKVFKEKFADPEYYSRKQTRQGSSLGGQK